MTRFSVGGFEGTVYPWSHTDGDWCACIVVADVEIKAWGHTMRGAKDAARRKLDAVERAFRERGRR